MLLRNKRVGTYIHIHVLVCQEFNPLMMKYQNVKWFFFYKYRDTLFLVIVTGKCMVSSLIESFLENSNVTVLVHHKSSICDRRCY